MKRLVCVLLAMLMLAVTAAPGLANESGTASDTAAQDEAAESAAESEAGESEEEAGEEAKEAEEKAREEAQKERERAREEGKKAEERAREAAQKEREAASKLAEGEREAAQKATEADRELAQKRREALGKIKEAAAKLKEAQLDAAGNPAKAAEFMARALQKAQELEAKADALVAAAEAKAAELLAKGEAKLAESQLEAAALTLEAAAQLNPGSRDLYRKIGSLYKELGKEAVKVWVKGRPVQVEPVVREGRTLVPLRALAEALGAEVAWDAATQTVTFTKGGNTVSLQIGSQQVLLNGQEVTIDVPAALLNSRTFVPLRAVAELLETQVDYDAEAGTVIVVDPNAPPAIDESTSETAESLDGAPADSEGP